MDPPRRKRLKRQTDSTIIHFDYDCFYASVVENETPALKALPLAVQQKQIVVTCNYEARRRGLHKLQLIKDAKKVCPEVVIVLGEDLTRFRNASKELYNFLKSFSWNSKAERLGFDEVFMDVSDIVEYNLGLLNPNDLTNSYFCLSKNDPTAGFAYDASQVAGHTYPETSNDTSEPSPLDPLYLRLHLGSHLAKHLRQQLDAQKGYTCTVGVSTNKLLAKLVGNLHKPNGQTTLLPPYDFDADELDNVTSFIDGHEVGKIPGIGFKIAHKLRAHVLQRQTEFDAGLVYGGTKEYVSVCHVRKHPGIGPEELEKVLGGPGTPHGIGVKVWGLLNGCDDTEVGQAHEVPRQISIEDSYIRLDTLDEVIKELRMLAQSLIRRMHADLLEDDQDIEPLEDVATGPAASKRWLSYPKTVRLSTRPRPPQNPNGSRNRSFARISRSASMPNFIFSLKESVDSLADRLVTETLIPLFRKLHPEKNGWNLSLVNVGVTNMADAASEKGGAGRDISKMFRHQDDVLKQWRVEEDDDQVLSPTDEGLMDVGLVEQPVNDQEKRQEEALRMHETSREEGVKVPELSRGGSEDIPTRSQDEVRDDGGWQSEDEDIIDDDSFRCDQCLAVMPMFAMAAHNRWHALG